ncbi:PLC-like phosphodiesterase [Peniophora sp. CONT]|nr:PLC-like phosphodiesterase [Peniophora sp. CONT]
MAPKHASSWMQTHLHAIGDLPLSKLCIPASHDAGVYRLGVHTSFGTESNVLTQTRSIFDQLELGVRYFDIRPVLTSPAPGQPPVKWATGHYTGEGKDKIGWQGGNGVDLDEIIADVNRFTQENAELVFIEIGHLLRLTIDNPTKSDARGLTSDEQVDLLRVLGGLERLFSVSDGIGKDTPLQNCSLRQFVGGGKAAVVVLIDDMPGRADEIYNHHFWPMYMSNGQAYFDRRGASVTRMQSTGDAVWSTISFFQLFGAEYNSDSVLSLSKREQERRFPGILAEYAASGYPGSIAMDRVQNLDLLTFCLAVTWQNLNSGYGHTDTIIFYGGKLITHPLVHRVVREAIDNGRGLQVNNGSIGGGEDPWQGVTKSCAVYYHHNGLYKARFARENQTLHFEEDVLEITYGGKEIRDQAVYLRFLRAISQRERLTVTNDNLGGDPTPNVKKSCKVRFRDLNSKDVREEKKDEGGSFDFETFWEKMGKSAATTMMH